MAILSIDEHELVNLIAIEALKIINLEKKILKRNLVGVVSFFEISNTCLLYTSDAADDMQCVDLGGRRIIKKSYVLCVA